ncbi:DUF6566 family protein [Paraburkholderia phosphatilytica]|uniref:DUF6566 family protein n=1 Tax=Paraburkholderia phosphatilytica TaxID=2282883 RepID=UPI000E4FAD59|nr:DUF6566 family protein [Paraburkholderia phosphatilytica]
MPSIADPTKPGLRENRPEKTTPGEAQHIGQFDYRGHAVTVTAWQNSEGAWIPHVHIHSHRTDAVLPDDHPIVPEWATREEAVRDGVERARVRIDRQRPEG